MSALHDASTAQSYESCTLGAASSAPPSAKSALGSASSTMRSARNTFGAASSAPPSATSIMPSASSALAYAKSTLNSALSILHCAVSKPGLWSLHENTLREIRLPHPRSSSSQ
ncbi:hypothetical protein [Taibaiella soli]|uniref:Uncharacterized protein n=1 Tax=Taibaiella soli TaxID=1649169 RepID=A0A2W2BJ61_9BACT|nr:hypothetical protein [Taibaiella soli]PZF73486.1 hypothetical protein DN068_07110 [Taibaiella soli]